MDSGVSPFSSGALRPIICLPKGIEQRVRPEALGLIVGHECIHVARGDGWWRPAERAIADVLWFNPFAWTIRRELDIARELACDEAVVASSSSRRAYARTLRDVAGMVSGLSADAPATAMSIGGGGRLLAMRMKRTLATAGGAPGRAAIAGAILLACAGAPVAIAQALLIEAVQPPDPPPALEAPPAPPAPPVAETPAVPEVPAAPETPPAPPAPAAPQRPRPVSGAEPPAPIYAPMNMRVTVTPDATGATVALESLATEGINKNCSLKVTAVTGVKVRSGDTVKEGAIVGTRNVGSDRWASCHMSFPQLMLFEGNKEWWEIAVPLAQVATPAPRAAPAPIAQPSLSAPVDPIAPVAPVTAPSAIAPPVPFVPAVPSAPASPYQENQNSPASGFEALYETENPITLRGKIVKVEWSAPRSRLHLQEEGTERRWIVVGGSPYDLTSEQRASVQIGTDVVVRAYQTRDKRCDPACAAFGRDFNRPNGTPLVRPPVRAVAPSLEIAPTLPVARTPTPIQFTPGNSESVLEGAARRTSAFGYRTDPFSNTTVFHTGVDLAQKSDSPVRAPGDAVVTFAGTKEGYGRMVELAVTDNVRLRLGHLNRIEVELGEQVASGQVIGTLGSSGPGTGPHVHLEVLRDGNHVDPETVEGLVLFGG